MKRSKISFIAGLLSTAVVFAGSKPQQGTILSQTSVPCGAKKSKKQEIDLLCQQYVVARHHRIHHSSAETVRSDPHFVKYIDSVHPRQE